MGISNASKNILQIIEDFGPIRPSIIKKVANISTKNLYKHLDNLLEENLIIRKKFKNISYYQIPIIHYPGRELTKDEKLVDANYIYFSPSVDLVRGVNGLEYWCNSNHFNYEAELKKLATQLRIIGKLKRNNVISATDRVKSTLTKLSLNKVFFSDFYTIGHFCKTKLGQLVYTAKSAQNKDLIKEICGIIKPQLDYLISKYSISHIGFIPPSIKREVQFMTYLEKYLALNKTVFKIEKIRSNTPVPQKSLRKLQERIVNATSSISVDPTQAIEGNVLLIDDATGSGATLNETAKKIRKFCKSDIKIIGYTVVGSYKGFDVISEV